MNVKLKLAGRVAVALKENPRLIVRLPEDCPSPFDDAVKFALYVRDNPHLDWDWIMGKTCES